jgi:ATP-binding cassette subfamily F protein 3
MHRHRCIKTNKLTFTLTQREIEKLENYITKFGAKASHAASAQSKKKALEKIDRVEMPTELEVSVAKPTFSFPPPPVRFSSAKHA